MLLMRGAFCGSNYAQSSSMHLTISHHTLPISVIQPDKTRNAEWNGNRNSKWWGDFSQLVKIEKIKSFGISRYKVKLRFWMDLNSEETCGTNSNWDFCLIWICSWLKSPHHSGFRLPFHSAFWVSSSTERAVTCKREFSDVTEDSNSGAEDGSPQRMLNTWAMMVGAKPPNTRWCAWSIVSVRVTWHVMWRTHSKCTCAWISGIIYMIYIMFNDSHTWETLR